MGKLVLDHRTMEGLALERAYQDQVQKEFGHFLLALTSIEAMHNPVNPANRAVQPEEKDPAKERARQSLREGLARTRDALAEAVALLQESGGSDA